MTTIDPRLVALYNEYLENNKEEEFINMLYAILEMSTPEIRQKVRYARAVWKRRLTKVERDKARKLVDEFFAKMTPDELIKFQNTPWEDIPVEIREAMPKLVMHPEECNFVRIYELVNKNERQNEIVASRITRYMEKHGMITSDESGLKLHYERFCELEREEIERYKKKEKKDDRGTIGAKGL